MEKFRYILALAYNGKNYHGWQQQPNAPTIQAEIKKALKTILRHKICLFGAGRTDTGVHAAFYVAHFDTKNKIPDKQKFIHSLNALLPDDIAIYDVLDADETFNSRFDAVERTYKYFISKTKNPFFSDFQYNYRFDLDLKKMNAACKILKEYENFKSFEKLHSNAKTSICHITDAYWTDLPNQMVFTISADRFLRNMVRSIVGTMIDIGRNKISIDDFRKIIEKQDRNAAGTSAKAEGLFLTNIRYPQPLDMFLDTARKKIPYFFNFLNNMP
jgi:tRNA pseudouridine38-40 synthase